MSDPVLSGQAWRDFCATLARAGDIVLDEHVPSDPLLRIEGFRYLSRLTRLALEQYVEAGDTDFPFFYQLSHETAKIGSDNPDNEYWNARIDGTKDYRISGKRGTMFYFGIESTAMRYHIDGSSHVTGALLKDDIHWGPNGEFEIIASCNQPSGEHAGKDWLRLEPDSSVLILRQSAMDRKIERGGEFHIERLDGPATPGPLTSESLAEGLTAAGQFVGGVANTFADWTRMFARTPNVFAEHDQTFFTKAGGAKDIFYAYVYYQIEPDEALVIDVTPPECPYWNIQLNNWWKESFDYRFRNVTYNIYSARKRADGSVQFIISRRDPGAERLEANWLDNCEHREGVCLIRWSGAKEHPLPTTHVVKLAELEAGK